jgi:hypothetical protein
MKMMILAAAAVLSLGYGAAYAAATELNTAVTTVTRSVSTAPIGANPWNGSESWGQWNKDHPDDRGGEG